MIRGTSKWWKVDARERMQICVSILAITRGILYTVGPGGPSTFVLDQIGTVVPLAVYGVLWLAAGVWGVVDAFRHKRGRWPLVALVALFTFWGMAYIVTAFISPLYILTGLLYLTLAEWAGDMRNVDVLPHRPSKDGS